MSCTGLKTLVFLLLLSLMTGIAPAQTVAETIDIDQDIQLVPIGPSIYIHRTYEDQEPFGRFPSNGLIYIKNQKAILIDTPWDNEKTEKIVTYVKDTLGADIIALIIGHYHKDCLGGLEYIQSLGIESIASELTKKQCLSHDLPLPSTTFSDSYAFDFEGEEILCRYFGPGHTADNITVWIPSRRILFGGCLIRSMSTSNLGFTEEAVLGEWDKTVGKILAAYANIHIVVPGHGAHGGAELLTHTMELVRENRDAETLVSVQKNTANDPGFPIIKGPYFGQSPPGDQPSIFAPEILVKPKQAHSSIVFSKDGTRAYWCSNGIYFSQLEKNGWTTPRLVPFSAPEFSDDAPFLSPDGKRLFFVSKRPKRDSDTGKKENVWVVEIGERGWSRARPLPSVINEMFQHWQVSVDSEGALYFGFKPEGAGDRDIVCSRFENGEYQKPESLSNRINSEHNESNPFISPKGDYLIFTRRNNKNLEDGGQDVSLFLSFRSSDGSWSQAINLKKYLNFTNSANCAIVTRDGRHLFFLDVYEGRYQRYWISTGFIDRLRESARIPASAQLCGHCFFLVAGNDPVWHQPWGDLR